MSTDSTNPHQQKILKIRREIFDLKIKKAPIDQRISELQEELLSEIGQMQAEYLFPNGFNPGESMYRARENWGVSDA